MNTIQKYFSEALHELRQVQWPTKNHAVRISTITAIFVACSAAALGIIDYILNAILLVSH